MTNENLIQFRSSPELIQAIDAWMHPGESLDLAARELFEGLLVHGVPASLREVNLTEEEAALICDACNGLAYQAATTHLLWAQVADAIRDEGLDRKWRVDGVALVEKLRGLTWMQAFAVDYAVRCWWNICNNDERSVTLRRVGLVR